MSLELILIHVIFIVVCASASFVWGWVTGIKAHRDYIEEEQGKKL
tara:strand:+ start:77 stop:211 length:135 start_codon:yes stop_codon:yes gene_type:complete